MKSTKMFELPPPSIATTLKLCARVKSRYMGNGHPNFNRESLQWVYKPYGLGLMTIWVNQFWVYDFDLHKVFGKKTSPNGGFEIHGDFHPMGSNPQKYHLKNKSKMSWMRVTLNQSIPGLSSKPFSNF